MYIKNRSDIIYPADFFIDNYIRSENIRTVFSYKTSPAFYKLFSQDNVQIL